MLGSDTGGEAVGPTECDVAGLDTSRHVMGLCSRVDDLINGLHGEVEGHELADWVEASEGSANGKTTKARLGYGTVDDSFLAKPVEETFCDFVSVRLS
jgi:hypothetical protein